MFVGWPGEGYVAVPEAAAAAVRRSPDIGKWRQLQHLSIRATRTCGPLAYNEDDRGNTRVVGRALGV